MSATPLADEHRETRFVKAVRWRIHDPEEAEHVARSHDGHAARVRGHAPAMRGEAEQHDLMAAICREHAQALRSARARDGIAQAA